MNNHASMKHGLCAIPRKGAKACFAIKGAAPMRQGQPGGNEAGMTLLELMFAAGVVAIALSMVFGSLISISVMGEISESRTAAATALSSVVEEMRTMNLEDLLDYTPPAIEGPGEQFVVTVELVLSNDSTLTTESEQLVAVPVADDFDEDLPNPLPIRTTLTWQEDTGHVFRTTTTAYLGR